MAGGKPACAAGAPPRRRTCARAQEERGAAAPGNPGPRPPCADRKSAAHERNALSSHGLPPQYFRRGGA